MARSTALASSAGPLKPVKSSFCDRTTLQQNCPGADFVAAWDLSLDPSSSKTTDTGPHRLHGATVNMPVRAATGHNWAATEFDS